MKSVKPGRGPSMMGGVMGIAAALFGVLWTVMAPGIMKAFGLIFVVIAVVQAVYNFKNATGKERYSAYDIVDGSEEPDPLNRRYGHTAPRQAGEEANFCPYCGAPAEEAHNFCRRCGKPLE